MKTIQLFKFVTLFLLLPLVSFSTTSEKEKHTKEKTIKKSFQVNSNATLIVDNSYGNLDIITWNENRIDIEVIITTKSNDEEKAQSKLDDITVDFSATNSQVSAKTIFNKSKNSWWNWNGNNNVNMTINYIIKMPITNAVELSNDYGNINLDKLEGRATINCDYGKITTKELMADNNELSFDYTNNCYFEYIKSGKITADYSGFNVGKAKKLTIVADYTKSIVEIAEDITYNCDYGSITLGKVNSISGNGDYLTTRIGDVYKNVSIRADYGSIKIDRIDANANNVTIESDYVGITIGYDATYYFNFDINMEYASLKDYDGFEFNKKQEESGTNYYSGYYGSTNSGNLIKINSDYGSVSLNKN